MTARGVFVTGTDTGVGKTVVTASLLAVLRAGGIDAVPMKPVQTGAERRGRGWAAPDLDFCLAAAGLRVDPEEYRLMAPACYELPASPHLAAAQAGEEVSLAAIEGACRELAGRHELVVAEGAGGVLVPLDGAATMLDLMKRLAFPVILVARTNLGTINHTLLSVRELARAGVTVLGIVFCDAAPRAHGLIEEDNMRTIPLRSGIPVIGYLPYCAAVAAGPMSPEAFARWCRPHVTKAEARLRRMTSP